MAITRTSPRLGQKDRAKQNDHAADEHNRRRLRSYEPSNEESGSEGRSRSATQLSGNSQTSPEPDKGESPPKNRNKNGNGVPRQDLQTVYRDKTNTRQIIDPRPLQWWLMDDHKLIDHARSRGYTLFPNRPKLSHKARKAIIKWLKDRESITAGITPDPPERPLIISTVDTTPNTAQKQHIATEEERYLKWSHGRLASLARQRSYTISTGIRDELPQTTEYLAHWLASWDVLLSDREKQWWASNGRELGAKAFSQGYKGINKKYAIIAWLVERGEDLDVKPKELKNSQWIRRPPKQKTRKRKTKGPEEGGFRGSVKRLKSS
ncbi:hypothetical protein IFR05_014453 [Cadophora sp. M221]|nr:hypothetical protein IFR05_014453 [Cadophora sp. M221]